MKKLLIVLIGLCSLGLSEHNSDKGTCENYELGIGDVLTLEDLEIKFASVLSDFRCPSDVVCVQAGEAIVEVLIFESGQLISKKELTFAPTVSLLGLIYESTDLKITGLQLAPYPEAETPIEIEDYRLALAVE